MNDRIFKTIVGLGLLIVISLCGFLVFHENKGCANESFAVEQNYTNRQGEALLEMFKIGLLKNQINNSADVSKSSSVGSEYYYGMVEAAIQQSSQYPELIADFWHLFENHLDSITVTPVARIEILDLFKQQVEQCANHCKNIEQYKKIWNTSENIDKYRTQIINSEVEKELKLFEEIADKNAITKVLKRDNDAIVDLVIAYNFLTDYSSESSEEHQKRFNNLIKTAVEQIISEIKTKYKEYENTFISIKDNSQKELIKPVILSNSDKGEKFTQSKIEYGIGVSHQLLLDLQEFITKDLNANVLQSLSSISLNDIIEIQANATNLLEKTRILNQNRYNIWANRVISDAGRVTQFDGMSMISAEFLYPVVAAFYNNKMDETLKKLKDPAIISHNVSQMILKNKAPLSAF